LATLKQQTDALLNSFASFIIAATGLPVYLYGREFTRPAGQYITLNVLCISFIHPSQHRRTETNGT
jgi:hypothetical protein